MRLILCALLASVLLAGCGGSDDEEPTAQNTPQAEKTEAPEKESSSGGDAEAEIRETFDSYNAALADRDFDKACEGLSPETTDKLRENVKKLGVTDPPEDCGELLGTVYETIDKDPQQKKLIDEIAKSAEIDKITVKGETATIDWHAMANGQKTPISQTARLVDGEWKLVDVTN